MTLLLMISLNASIFQKLYILLSVSKFVIVLSSIFYDKFLKFYLQIKIDFTLIIELLNLFWHVV